MTGIMQVILSISYAVLVYGGDTNSFTGQGIGFTLAGALVIATIISLFAAVPGTVGSNQDVSVAILSLISTSIVSTMPTGSSPETAFFTVVAAISLTVLLAGIFLFGVGYFRLGGLIRYFPYPIVGGFLAGTGWLLFSGGFTLILGEANLMEMFKLHYAIQWGTGLLFALILLYSAKHFKSKGILPGLLLGGVLIFYGSANSLGYSLEVLRDKGWLLSSFPSQALLQPLSFSDIALVRWEVIAGQVGNILTVIIVSSIALLLNASAFEIESKQSINLNQELRLAGICNLLSSICPGFVGFRQLSLSVLNFRLNVKSRMVGIVGACIIGIALFCGASVITYFPKVLMGGVLMYLGLTFLYEWAFQTFKSMPRIDFLIIWLVLLVITTVGFMTGIVVGLVAALIMFVISYSRTELVRHELSGKNFQSPTPRSLDQQKLLDSTGEQLYILQLQGFIFFGTANKLYNKMRMRLKCQERVKPRFVLLDFQRVEILDTTGMLSFCKMKELMRQSQIHLVITSASFSIKKQLLSGGLSTTDPAIHYFPSIDVGIEWCEEQLLEQHGSLPLGTPSLLQQLTSIVPGKTETLKQIFALLERVEVAPGTQIIAKGQSADSFFFLESGSVKSSGTDTSQVDHETTRNCPVVGDIGFYLGCPCTTSVVAVEKCTLYRLTAEELKRLETGNPELSAIFHQLMVYFLADRVRYLVKTVNALQK